MAGILDSSRFIYFITRIKVPVQIKSFVLGGHGDTMVAMLESKKLMKNFWLKEGKKQEVDEIWIEQSGGAEIKF